MAQIERLQIYPVKGFDATVVDAAEVTEAGTLRGDREYAVCVPEAGASAESPEAERAINAKQTARIHELRTEFDAETGVLTVTTPERETRRFDLDAERDAAGEWLGAFLGREVSLGRRPPPGFVDRPDAGPSVVSTATLEAVASWFDEMTVEGARRRLRANVEVSGVPAFWEDQFVGASAPTFIAGDVRFEGVEPCARCVVPQRDPETGEPTPRFRERFLERREATLPEWADREAFDHLYSLMLIARVPEASRGRTLRVGDEVRVESAEAGQ